MKIIVRFLSVLFQFAPVSLIVILPCANILRPICLSAQSITEPYYRDPNDRLCGTNIMQNGLLNSSPAIEEKLDSIEENVYSSFIQKSQGVNSNSSSRRMLYTIPVVVHIIHDNGNENISNATVIQGIKDLNDAYRNVGAYLPLTGVDVEIEFCLAQQDENGNYTTGINRVQDPLTNMTMESQDLLLKNLVRWNPVKYLNIWLAKEIASISMGPGVAGYAYFPSSHGNPEDGIVAEARWFGSSTDNSKVLVHEAGHYLGLYHTFEAGCANNDCLADGDKVCDTPPDASTAPVNCGSSVNTCTTDADDQSANNPFRPVSLGGTGDQDDLVVDYMDYGFQSCQSAFTEGQRDRMIFMLTGVRSSLLQSIGCLLPCANPIVATFNASNTSVTAGSAVSFTNLTIGATGYEWTVNGTTFSTSQNASYTFNTQGNYTVSLEATTGDPACRDEFSLTIQVICPVNASFNPDNTSISPGGNITFANTSTGATSYEWLLDGISLGTSVNLTHTFNNVGGFMVSVVAYNGICHDTASSFVQVGLNNCKHANIWYFGDSLGLDFNSGQPVVLTDGALSTDEGCASMTDENGNLLFYTDGVTVWNKNHAAIPNGTGLKGHFTTTQSALIVPRPGNSNTYFVFTLEPGPYASATQRLHYSLVDMALDGGNGDIVPGTKNTFVTDSLTEKLTGVKHCNGDDVWVITHRLYSDAYEALLVTSQGLNTLPVVSHTGTPHQGTSVFFGITTGIGYLKASIDGSRLAVAILDTLTLEVLDFDKATGIVSNPITLPLDSCQVYGVEFSADGSKLYVGGINLSDFTDFSRIYQFDLNAGSALDIANSATLIGTSGFPSGVSALQMGPNGKIYVTRKFGTNYLGVINTPNASGLACNYIDQAIYFGNDSVLSGLPNFISSYVLKRDIHINGEDSVCAFTSGKKYFMDDDCLRGITWSLTGKSVINHSTDSTIFIDFHETGTDTLIAEKTTDCSTVFDTLFIHVTPAQPLDLGNDTTICQGANIVFDAGPEFASYQWQNGSSSQTLTAATTGVYWVKASQDTFCVSSDTVLLEVADSSISLNLSDDTICQGGIATLNPGSGYTGYRWQDNSRNQTFTAWLPGTYSVTVTNACGSSASGNATVTLKESIAVDLGDDTVICEGATITFDAGNGYISYLWQDGSSANSYSPSSSGAYWVVVTDSSGCFGTDTVEVHECTTNSPPLIIWDVFSPNGDGTNDEWVIDGLGDYPGNELQIFNRWGNVVFEAKPYNNAWKGISNKGEALPSATYYYILKLDDIAQSVYSGSVTVVR